MPEQGETPETSPARAAAARLFEGAQSGWLQLTGPSKEVSEILWRMSDADNRDRSMVEVAICAGYATRLAQADESPTFILPQARNQQEAMAEILRSGLVEDERFFNEVIPFGEAGWEVMLESWGREMEPWLMYEARGRYLDAFQVDTAIRIGYFAAIVDRSFGLEPRRRTDEPSLPARFALLIVPPAFLLVFFTWPLIVCLAAALNLPNGEPAQIVAIGAAALTCLAPIGHWAFDRRFPDGVGGLDPGRVLPFAPWATGMVGIALFIYSLF